MRTCGKCGQPLVRRPDEHAKQWSERLYCSRRCTASKPRSTNSGTGRGRANRIFVYQPCEVCGAEYAGRGTVHRHHRDANPLNNDPSNIAFLCAQHHKDAHRALNGRIGGGPRPRVVAMQRAAAMQRWEKARQLKAAGRSYAEIGEELGFGGDTVRHWFARYGR